ncbi:MAG: hypothetical protein U0166_02545 [Acidobacteriota bacterium]
MLEDHLTKLILPERLFACSLLAGLGLSLLLGASGGRLFRLLGLPRLPRFPRLPRVARMRVPRAKLARAAAREIGPPSAVPLVSGVFLTIFGAAGLAARGMLGFETLASAAVALGCGGVAALLGARALAGLLEDGSGAVRGATLLGAVGRVSLAIPDGGVGSVSYVVEGRRSTLPARTRSGAALPAGCRVVVLAFEDRVALVEGF